jgi:predicted nucleotidyltransferase
MTRSPDTLPTPPATEPLHAAVGSVLEYFGLFRHPLRADEIRAFLPIGEVPAEALDAALRDLVERGVIFRFDFFFQIKNDPAWVTQRTDSNQRADALLPTARRISRFIGGFPFVRAVMVSGSLSKHCMRPDSDIDFFVVTTPGRLWLARTLLVLFKKIFLFNSHKYFCVNYFVDTEHLQIEDQNLFTATEVVTLLPMQSSAWYDRFVQANHWAWARFYPNLPPRTADVSDAEVSRSVFKSALEWLLGGRLGAWLDVAAMRGTVAFWRKKFKHFDAATFDSALRSRRYVSKHHPLWFQKKVLDAHAEGMRRWQG